MVSVGRLDLNSEGLLLLTNDGGLARKLELPANAWLRRYKVRVHGTVDPARLVVDQPLDVLVGELDADPIGLLLPDHEVQQVVRLLRTPEIELPRRLPRLGDEDRLLDRAGGQVLRQPHLETDDGGHPVQDLHVFGLEHHLALGVAPRRDPVDDGLCRRQQPASQVMARAWHSHSRSINRVIPSAFNTYFSYTGYELPVWYAAYGPKALTAAGKYGDGLILQMGDPWLVKYFADQAIQAGKDAGRDMSTFKIMSAAPVWVGDMETGRKNTGWFPAMVGNHVADLVEKYGASGGTVPQRLTDYIAGRKDYDYRHHAEIGASHLSFIKEDIIDSFSILGNVEEHVAKLKELESIGVTQFNIYLMCGEEERIVAEYAEHIIPHFQ